jgi:hypothetical protein
MPLALLKVKQEVFSIWDAGVDNPGFRRERLNGIGKVIVFQKVKD